MTAEHGKRCRSAAVMRDIVIFDPSRTSDQPHREIRRSPRSGVGKVELARILLGVLDDLTEVLPGRLGANGKDSRTMIDTGNRCELVGTDGNLLNHRKDSIRSRAAEGQCVAIGLRPDYLLGSNGSAATRLQDNQQRLAEILMGYARHRARRQIVRPAGGVRENKLYGFGRKLLCGCDGPEAKNRQECD